MFWSKYSRGRIFHKGMPIHKQLAGRFTCDSSLSPLCFCRAPAWAFAQVDTPPNAVPEQTDGNDYAGRPVAGVKVPPAPPLSANQQQFQQDVKDIHFDFDRSDLGAEDRTIQLGVSPDRILFATGWGKLYPICTESEESCWSQNRRTHIAPCQPVPTQPTEVALAALSGRAGG